MAAIPESDWVRLTGTPEHRAEMIRIGREVNEMAGITGEITMTPEEIQAAQRARGIRAEDCVASRELMRMRYGDDWEEDGG